MLNLTEIKRLEKMVRVMEEAIFYSNSPTDVNLLRIYNKNKEKLREAKKNEVVCS